MFVDYVHGKCEPMKVNNEQILNGSMFGQMVRCYVETVNSKEVLCIEKAVKTLSFVENTQAVESAVEKYKSEMQMNMHLPVSDEKTLTKAHEKSVKDALNLFTNKSFLNNNREFYNTVNIKIWEGFEEIKEEDETKSRTYCYKYLEELYAPIKRSFDRGSYFKRGGYKKYNENVRCLIRAYEKTNRPLGVMKNETLCRFMEECEGDRCKVIDADDTVTTLDQKEYDREKEERNKRWIEELYNKSLYELSAKEGHILKGFQTLKAWCEKQQARDREQTKKIAEDRERELKRLKEEKQKEEIERTEQELRKLSEEREKKQNEIRESLRQLEEKEKAESDRLREERQRIQEEQSTGFSDAVVATAATCAATGAVVGSLGGPVGAAIGAGVGGLVGAGVGAVAKGASLFSGLFW